MRKLLAVLAAGLICFGALAQESSILDDWEAKIEGAEDDFFSTFSFLDFTYNNFLGASAKEGVNQHGWGFEISALHIGFNPWHNGRFTLGLFDMAFDFGFLTKGYTYAADLVDKQIIITPVGAGVDSNKSSIRNFAYMFPVGYIQKFGYSKWSAAIMASPGFGWSRYRNEWVDSNIKQSTDMGIDKGDKYFRLDVKAMIWYENVGIVARYTFPRDFKGLGVVSAGISLRI